MTKRSTARTVRTMSACISQKSLSMALCPCCIATYILNFLMFLGAVTKFEHVLKDAAVWIFARFCHVSISALSQQCRTQPAHTFSDTRVSGCWCQGTIPFLEVTFSVSSASYRGWQQSRGNEPSKENISPLPPRPYGHHFERTIFSRLPLLSFAQHDW